MKGKSKFIWLFLSLTLLIIAVQQTLTQGLRDSYWIYMFSLAFLFIYWYINGPGNERNK